MKNQIKVILMAAAVLGSVSVAKADSMSLAYLIAHSGASDGSGSLTIGDKVFDNFGSTSSSSLYASVNISTVTYNTLYGIDITGVTTGDLLLTYSVHTVGGSYLISDVHQDMVVTGTGDYSASVSESVGSDQNMTQASDPSFTYAWQYGSLSGSHLSDQMNLYTPLQIVWINKDIDVSIIDGTLEVNHIYQTFSQVTVPDGGITFAFLSFALVSVEGLRRKLKH